MLDADRYLRRKDVEEMTGLSRSSIYRLMDQGDFPRPHRVTQRAVRWLESDVRHWMGEESSRCTT
jgi:prophage regulatory protein